jgi:hypothetical protein
MCTSLPDQSISRTEYGEISTRFPGHQFLVSPLM